MSPPDRFDRLVSRYPAKWRARYGVELTALLADTYGDRLIPLRQRASLFRSAFFEHVRASGFSADASPARQTRVGALLVLCAWAVFMVTGSAFAKYLEHWDVAIPAPARRIPADAVTAVTYSAVVAVALVATGALALAMPLARSVRAEGWGELGRAMRAAVLLLGVALLVTVGLIFLAHSQTAAERSGGSWVYLAVGVVWGMTLLATLAVCTWAAVLAARRVELRGAVLRVEALSALGVFLCMVIVLAGTATWWATVAVHAPRFLETSLGPVGTWGSVVPPVMLGITVAMIVALMGAAAGSWRILVVLRTAG